MSSRGSLAEEGAMDALFACHPELRKRFNGDHNKIISFLGEIFITSEYTLSVARIFKTLLPLIMEYVVENHRHDFRSAGFRTHDMILRALSKTLPFYQKDALYFIEKHISGCAPLMDRLPQTLFRDSQVLLQEQRLECLEILKIIGRLLRYCPERFFHTWNFSPLFSIYKYATKNLHNQEYKEIYYCSSNCLALYLQLCDHQLFYNLPKDLPDFSHIEFLLSEQEALYFEKYLAFCDENKQNTIYSSSVGTNSKEVESQKSKYSENKSLVEIFGVWLHKRNNEIKYANVTDSTGSSSSNSLSENHHKLVYTNTTVDNITSICQAISQQKPILLEGVTGSGKTAIVEHLASLTNNFDLIKVNLDESFDSKDLLGSYVCTDVPGEFKWQPGALTKAVQQGRWILIEDIDLAPFDIITALIPLIESNTMYLPTRDEHICAAPGFQLFATQTLIESISGSSVSSRQRTLPMSNIWNHVLVKKLPIDEIRELLNTKYATIKSAIPKFIETYESLKGEILHGNNSMDDINIVKDEHNGLQAIQFGRQFSLRDLLKWCERVQRIYSTKISQNNYITSQLKEDIFRESMDLFCGMIPKQKVRDIVTAKLASVWKVPTERVAYFDSIFKPLVQESAGNVTVGRINLPRDNQLSYSIQVRKQRFAHTKQGLQLLEKIAVCVKMNEPVLLTGETGVGKTSIIQHLANLIGRKLVVHNLNQQTDSSDFIGGYKPIDIKILAASLRGHFEKLFSVTFSKKHNDKLLEKVMEQYNKKNWKAFAMLLEMIIEKAVQKCSSKSSENDEMEDHKSNTREQQSPSKQRKKKKRNDALAKYWKQFHGAVLKFNRQHLLVKNTFAFSFVEGSLIKALKEGQWILLDEINLASTETLERLSSLLEGEEGTLFLTEKGETEPIKRHPNFRIFACMNPPTDIGKKNLPPALRNRFTEFYIRELLDKDDLQTVVTQYLEKFVDRAPSQKIVSFYLLSRKLAEAQLSDGSNQKPHYSLRTLVRALEYSTAVLPLYGLDRALYEGFCMGFLTLLSRSSYPLMESKIKETFVPNMHPNALRSIPRKPGDAEFIQFEHFWMKKGPLEVENNASFIITDSVKEHLKNIARVVSVGKYPVLLQGPTSSGKTSMIQYLAKLTGHRFVRINNHESTDLQEYFGSYITNTDGKLSFQEGILVEAVRNGYWIVLDELNLAPSDILEALNRLLDDNRELFIPETQETIKPHPHFQLFATQNPPGIYGGRKMLSRAFRNRFQEIHVDDIPDDELEIILQRRCSIPLSKAKKIVLIMKDLQRKRQESNIFAGKSGFITPRDLFRWADRQPSTDEELAKTGYALLAERLRSKNEKLVVKKTLEQHLKITINEETLYECEDWEKLVQQNNALSSIVWTSSMKRLFSLVGACIKYKEPVLLVGETGCGKTTVCQLYSLIMKKKLHILNCHMHTESSDFLGSLRPVRGREQLFSRLKYLSRKIRQTLSDIKDEYLSSKLDTLDENDIHQTVKVFDGIFASMSDLSKISSHDELQKQNLMNIDDQDITDHDAEKHNTYETYSKLKMLYKEWKSLFVWYDGPLVQAMKQGDLFLIDEISLAEDAVLERLNSVLEPERTLVLPEKGSEQIEEIIAREEFRIFATMNPGGDFGKRELSPALRNRFTEIYVPSILEDNAKISSSNDLHVIINDKLNQDLRSVFTDMIAEFITFFKNLKTKKALSIRDILSWIQFLNLGQDMNLSPYRAYLHGAELVILEGLGIGTDIGDRLKSTLRKDSMNFLLQQVPKNDREKFSLQSGIGIFDHEMATSKIKYQSNGMFGIYPFFIETGKQVIPTILNYTLEAPTTHSNVIKVLRAMKLRKPLLLEGSPGVGKTSLIQSIAKAAGHRVVRINLSEQTDMMDLLGTDLPVEGSSGGEFQWSDGIFLQALKAGDWVLLDELNLASQSVLEGLNSVLDHRAQIFIPELNRTFDCPPTFRIFACQNPLNQGGGRKGLPKSFLNRFTQIYIEELKSDDLFFIANAMHSEIGEQNLRLMIEFNERMHVDSMVEHKFGRKGSPWEFNLRDIFRWCELMKSDSYSTSMTYDPSVYVELVYLQRLRTEEDREYVMKLFQSVFTKDLKMNLHPNYVVAETHLQIGHVKIERKSSFNIPQQGAKRDLYILHNFLNPLQMIVKCVQMNYMCILTGCSASGKTSIVRTVAQLTGNKLHEFSMSSSTDTMELLGGFEQLDAIQRRRCIAKTVSDHIKQFSQFYIQHKQQKNVDEMLASLIQLQNNWIIYEKKEKGLNDHKTEKDANEMVEILEALVSDCIKLCKKLNFSQSSLLNCQNNLDDIKKLTIEGVKGRFEWSDGILIKALESGDWILIEHVNFCAPTVLDRLNSLLEPNGLLVVNERGIVDGEVKVVRPHPNFRIFMTFDPKYGEISRAMRNRGIEIFMTPISVPSQDALVLLADTGVPSIQLCETIMTYHSQFCQNIFLHSEEDKPTIRDLIRCGENFTQQLIRGVNIQKALDLCIQTVYIRNKSLTESSSQLAFSFLREANENFSKTLSAWKLMPSPLEFQSTFRIRKFSNKLSNIMGQAAYFNAIIRQVIQVRIVEYLYLKGCKANVLSTMDVRALIGSIPISKIISLHFPSFFLESLLRGNMEKQHVQSLYQNRCDVSELVQQLGYCVTYLIEMETSTDFSIRIWLLQRFYDIAVQFKDIIDVRDVLSVIQEGISVMKARSSSSIYNSLIFLLYGEKKDIQNYNFPINIIFAEDVYKFYRYSNMLPPSASRICERFDLLNEHLYWVEHKCKMIKKEISFSLSGQDITLLDQAIWFHKNPSQKNRASSEIIPLLIPLFEIVDHFIEVVIRQDTEDENGKYLKNLFLHRNNMWKYLNHNNEIREDFLIYWNWINKMCQSTSNFRNISQLADDCIDDLIDITSKINSFCARSIGDLSKKNTLWKFCGKPKVIENENLKVMKKKLLEQCLKWLPGDKASAEIMINGLCTIEWMNRNRDVTKVKEMEQVLSDIVSKIVILRNQSSCKDSSDPMITIERELDQLFEKIREIDQSNISPKKGIVWKMHTAESIKFLHDYESVLSEIDLYSNLYQTYIGIQFEKLGEGKLITNNLNNIKNKCQDIIDYALSKCTRPLTDIVPYQNLAWKIGGNTSFKETNDLTNLSKVGMCDLILQSAHEISMTWHSRLWSNTYQLDDVDDEGINERKVRLQGPSALFENVKIPKVLAILQNWSSVPIRARHSKIRQLRTVLEFLLNEEAKNTNSVIKSDWKSAIYIFATTITCFSKKFEDFEKVELILEKILLFCREGLHEINFKTLSTDFERLLKDCKDERLKQNSRELALLVSLIPKLQAVDDVSDDISRGHFWTILGLCRLRLITPGQALDPTLKYSVMISHLQSIVSRLDKKLETYKRIQYFLNGAHYNYQIQKMEDEIIQHNQILKELGMKAVRRPNIEFKQLYNFMTKNIHILVDNDKINNLLSIMLSKTRNHDVAIDEIIEKENIWQKNASEFIHSLLTKYAGFEDITEPVISTIYQLKYGVRILCNSCVASRIKNMSPLYITIDKLISMLLQYPSSNCLNDIIEQINAIGDFFNMAVLKNEEDDMASNFGHYEVILKVLKALLSKINLRIVTENNIKLDNEEFNAIHCIFSLYSKVWKKLKDEIDRRRREEEDLFKYKEKVTHIESDDEILEKEIESMFPSFLRDYSEFIEIEDLKSEKNKIENMREGKLKRLEKLYEQTYGNYLELQFIFKRYDDIFEPVSKLQIESKDQDRCAMYDACFSAASCILNSSLNTATSLNNIRHLPLIAYCCITLENLSGSLILKNKSNLQLTYNPYTDTNIPELNISFTIIHELIQKLNNILKKYEEHPLLIQMIQLCEHILNLPIHTPVMKVLTGIEVIMKKAVEWQEGLTSPGGSIQAEINKVTSLILRWRKIELDNWRSILDSKKSLISQKVNEWFFKFYELLFNSDFGQMNDEEMISVETQFMSLFDDFMRSSSVGEFDIKLKLLKRLYEYLNLAMIHIDKEDELHSNIQYAVGKVCNITYHTYRFYEQFHISIQEHVQKELKPHEKGFSDFLKLRKWDDVNYDSIRFTTQQAKRKLAKFSREYDLILSKPAKIIWENFESNFSQELEDTYGNKKKKSKTLTVGDFDQVIQSLSEKLITKFSNSPREKKYFTRVELDLRSLNNRVLQVCTKIHQWNKEKLIDGDAMNECEYLVQYLEDISTKVIIQSKKLQKQEKLVKKRAFLSLISILKEFGIPYRSKQVESIVDMRNIFQHDHLSSTIQTVDHTTADMSSLWQRCDSYFYRNLLLLQQLRFASVEISKDVQQKGPIMKGFAENLLATLIKQRNVYVMFERDLGDFGKIHSLFQQINKELANVDEVSTITPHMPQCISLNQHTMKFWVRKLKRYFDDLLEILEQQSLLFNGVKKVQQNMNDQHIAKFPELLSSIYEIKRKFDHMNMSAEDHGFVGYIVTNKEMLLAHDACCRFLEFCTIYEELKSHKFRSDQLINVLKNGIEMCTEFTTKVFNKSDTEMQLEKMIGKGWSEDIKLVANFSKQFNEAHNQVIHRVKLMVQNMRNQGEKLKKAQDNTAAEGESVENNELNCMRKMKEHFEKTTEKMNLKLMNNSLRELIKLLNNLSENTMLKDKVFHTYVLNVFSKIVMDLVPLLSYVQGLLDIHKVSLLYCHKSMCKLEYILLSTFINLMKNGFCEKPESEQEGGEGTGTTEFTDGTGMDDGEGKVDVSEEIEDEEQILDSKDQKQNDREQKKDIEENENGIEMEQDFQSKLFDVEDDEYNEEDGEEEENEQEEVEKEMGDINEDDENTETLDKKLWPDEEDDENEKEEEHDSKTNENNNDSEIRAKDEKEPTTQNENNEDNKKEDRKQNQKPSIEDPSLDDIEQEEFDDVIEDENQQGKEGTNDDDGDEDQDNMNHNEEEFQLPENLNLDEQIDDSDNVDDMSDDEDMNEDNLDENEVAPLQKQDQQNNDEDVESDEIDTEQKQDMIEENDETNEEQSSKVDPMVDNEENAKSEEREDEAVEEEEDQEIEKEEAFDSNLKETPFGVKHTTGKSSEVHNKEDEEKAEEKTMKSGEDSGNDFNNQDNGDSWERGDQNENQESNSKSGKNQFDPNPYRSLGDALKKWREKLQVLDKKEEEQVQEKEELLEKSNEEKTKEPNNAQTYEHIKEEMETHDETQVLAPATTEQAEQFPQLDLENKEESNEEHDNEDNLDKQLGDEEMKENEDANNEENQRKSNQNNAANSLPKHQNQDMEEKEKYEISNPTTTNQQDLSMKKTNDSTFHLRETSIDEISIEEEYEQNRLTMDDITMMKEEYDMEMNEWKTNNQNMEKGKELWRKLDIQTSSLAQELCEQLRLILEPTLATKLKGDYKTGKRINMKKIIPYIASQFRKDKIWLRRTKPNKRQYQVLVAVDDSMSMAENNAGKMACESVSLLCKAMSQLEVGQLGVVSFGEDMKLLHPFDKPFTDESGADIVSKFTFNQKQTRMAQFMEDAIQLLEAYRSFELVTNSEQLQLCFILSDGRILDREDIVKLVRKAHEKKQLFVFILIDNPNPSDSVLEIKSISYDNKKKLQIHSYMDQFPFPYYIILRELQHLPQILADALRQWFELINMLASE